MRNEQAACYAAQAIGYLTGQPGIFLFTFYQLFVYFLLGIYLLTFYFQFFNCLFTFFTRYLFGSFRTRTFTRSWRNGQCQRKFLALIGDWWIIRYWSGKLWSFSGMIWLANLILNVIWLANLILNSKLKSRRSFHEKKYGIFYTYVPNRNRNMQIKKKWM